MKKVKVILVEGRVLRKGGETVRTLASDIENAVNDFQKTVDGKVGEIDVKVDFVNMLSTGGRASIVIEYEGDIKDDSKSVSKAKGGK